MTDRQSSAGLHDFDFLYGQWLVRNRRLRQPLSGALAWDEFDAWYRCWPLLEGIGHVDELHTDDCGPLHASLRLYEPQARRWNVYGVRARDGMLQPPLAAPSGTGSAGFTANAVSTDAR